MAELVGLQSYTKVPTKVVEAVKINGVYANGEFDVPIATYEKTLWPSLQRGARVTRLAGGIKVSVLKDVMTRSVVLEADGAARAAAVVIELEARLEEMKDVTRATSSICSLEKVDSRVVGNLIFLRFGFNTGDASGHNMSTKASDALIEWVLEQYKDLKYVSISGNYCVDKKNSAVNGILGRGKYVVADIVISKELCLEHLRATPEKIVELNVKKNLLGSVIAGSVASANAHFANILLGIYLSTGQDAANIIEGSQGITHAEVRAGDLYFSVTLPNIIVGTVGNGKDLEFVRQNLELMGCNNQSKDGTHSKKLASIIAATVLCGELSLLAAQTNRGELNRSHMYYERKNA